MKVLLIDPDTGAAYRAGTVTVEGTGVATAAKQDTGNGSLATLVTQTDGIEGSLASILAKIIAAPATAAKQDALAALIGDVDDEAWAGTGDGTVISILKAIAINTAA